MVYLQSNDEKTLPHHFDVACALYGAVEMCQNYRLTTFEEVESGKFDSLIKTNLFVGSVEFMREVFSRIGILNAGLKLNSNRKSDIITLEDAHKRVYNGEKLFIKPVQIKLFSGLILDGCLYSCLEGLPLDTLVRVYEPFNSRIESEWRVYIDGKTIVDSKNYSGDFKISPDYNFIESIISEYSDQLPRNYTMDIGILESQQNVVVEFNDMWAIGNYGIPNDEYYKLLRNRYFDIIRND